MTDAEDALAELLGAIDRTMWILTVADGGQRSGCLMGFATQSSLEPPRFLACVSRANHTFALAVGAEHVAVHAAPDEADLALARLFGEETGDEIDKFARCEWHEGPEGQPILIACPAWFVGRVIARHDLGDHVGLLLDPVAVRGRLTDVLTFERAQDLDAAH
jgi:flavin reductase (DIM6/NTAB) family NADH-FMN oxidoreductase RutF